MRGLVPNLIVRYAGLMEVVYDTAWEWTLPHINEFIC